PCDSHPLRTVYSGSPITYVRMSRWISHLCMTSCHHSKNKLTYCKVYFTLCIGKYSFSIMNYTGGFPMTYQEKKSIVSIFSVILIFVLYCLYMYPRYPEGGMDSPETLRYWGSFVLILILVSIIAHIVISIVFSIVFRMTT